MPDMIPTLFVGTMLALYFGYPAFQTLMVAVAIYWTAKTFNYLFKKFGFVRKSELLEMEAECQRLRLKVEEWKGLFDEAVDERQTLVDEATHEGRIHGQEAVFSIYRHDVAAFQRHYLDHVKRETAKEAEAQKRKDDTRQKTNRRGESVIKWRRVLGVAPDATEDAVKAVYKALVRQWHPDQFTDPTEKETANQKLRDINAAHDEAEKHFKAVGA